MENSTTGHRSLQNTLVVDTLVDENDGSLAAGDVSLREALAAVSAGGTITFSSELANQDTGYGQGVLGLTLGELVVDRSVTIAGLGADALTISGDGRSRVFRLDDGDQSISSDVTMTGLAIANGVGEQAGGILSAGENLTFAQGSLTRNTGGIATFLISESDRQNRDTAAIADILVKSSQLFANQDFALSTQGRLTLTDSLVIGTAGVGIRHVGNLVLNTSGVSDGKGRGIVSRGTLELLSSRVESNIGDGIKHVGALTAKNSSITGNGGDGIISVGDLQLANSQIEGNGLSGLVINDTLEIESSSIFNNGQEGIGAFAATSNARLSTTDSFIGGNLARNIGQTVNTVTGPVASVSAVMSTAMATESTPRIGGSSGKDRIFGSNVGELIQTWQGSDLIRGKGGNDTIQGGIGDDRIHGGSGDDVLGGGKGRDRLSGGSGRDRFIYGTMGEGSDTITDFTVGKDLIDLSAIFSDEKYNSATPFEDYVRIGSATDNGTQISVLEISRDRARDPIYEEIALLNSVSAESLEASSFVV